MTAQSGEKPERLRQIAMDLRYFADRWERGGANAITTDPSRTARDAAAAIHGFLTGIVAPVVPASADEVERVARAVNREAIESYASPYEEWFAIRLARAAIAAMKGPA